MRASACVALLAGATGCGLGLQGLGTDGGAGSSGDGAVALDGAGVGVEGGPNVDASACEAPPPGWSLVLYETTRADCPSGEGMAHDELADPALAAGACGCSCDITTPGSCEKGTLQTQFSRTPPAQPGVACPTAGEAITISGPGCTPIPMVGQIQAAFSAESLPFTAGACTGSITADTSKLGATQVRFCDVPAAQAGAACTGAPAGFSACIVADGAMACPAGPFSRAIPVADGDELECPSCDACVVNGSCTGAQTQLFSDAQCQFPVTTLPCNAQCVTTSQGTGSPIAALEYTATVQSSCVATSSSAAASVVPTGPHTLCCL